MSRADDFAGVVSGEPGECWIWPLSIGSHGYGQWWDPSSPTKSKVITAPRAAFFYANGYWPNVVRHRCPNGPDRQCVNPAHLVDGTHKLNALDRIEDGAQQRGEAVALAALTDDRVAAARALRRSDPAKWTLARLAATFGVTRSTMASAVHGTTWEHVTEPAVDHVESWDRRPGRSA